MQAILDTDVAYLLEQALEQLPEELPCLEEQPWPLLLEFPLSSFPALEWLRGQRAVPQLYWRSRDGQREFAGCGEAIRFSAAADDAAALHESETELKRLLEEHPQAQLLTVFVAAQFNAALSSGEEWQEFPAFLAIVPEVCLIQDDGRYSAVVCLSYTGKDKRETLLRRACRMLEKSLLRIRSCEPVGSSVLERKDVPEQSQWEHACESVLASIESGEVEKLVLARRITLELKEAVQPIDLCAALQSRLGAGYSFAYVPKSGHAFTCQSPECLFYFNGNDIVSDALGGSAAKTDGSTKVSDLLESGDKLDREHEYVVRDIREKLAGLAATPVQRLETEVISLPYISHIRSQITARAAEGVDVFSLMRSLHPTPAVAGYPSAGSLAKVSEVESHPRGWYSGPVGVVRQSESEFAVALRGVLLRDTQAILYGGAGIVVGSKAALEWQEIEAKLAPILSVFDGAETTSKPQE